MMNVMKLVLRLINLMKSMYYLHELSVRPFLFPPNSPPEALSFTPVESAFMDKKCNKKTSYL